MLCLCGLQLRRPIVEAHSLIVLYRVYHWCRLRRCCDRLVPPAVVLVELCELVLPRGMPQTRVRAIPCETSVRSRVTDLDMDPYWVIVWFIVARFEC
ncbi:hypothetical protein Taro_054857, partial [Colocasia esculenta]|nr:hypothetical protein [Colocasia esculenta]